MRRKALLLTILLLCTIAQPAFAARTWQLNASAPIYNSIASDAQPIDTVPPGLAYDITEAVGNYFWIKIVYDWGPEVRQGWIRQDLLSVPSTPLVPQPSTLGQGFVLSETLSMRDGPNYNASRVAQVPYATVIILENARDGWYYGHFSDGSGIHYGWVPADFILENPVYFTTTSLTNAYAYPSTSALKVGQVEAYVTLPIIDEVNGFYAVSLRSGSAFIKK